ncbi:TolC family protein [Geotalea uraniireducens]|uniref:Outer membrane efflux protein n=1 Tax=Geotalea uraniireducens (strain Rf4) TaxID=351605 RepID=A5GDN5_GEOUR|nr:TolC family protein [Geotalea uraniireducens]ABQ24303.1 outer membrane efflux protein [Geotalea uraniireducens Rf4]
MIYRFVAVLVFFSLLSLRPVWADEAQPLEDLPRLVQTALANNPELKASDARWQMFRNRIVQARSFDDPMLMLKIQNGIVKDPFNFGRDPMTQKVIGISQQFPFFGKRTLKGEVAAKEAESYRWSVDERTLELKRMVKESYYQIYFIDKSLEIIDKNIRIIDDFITLAETKYSVGQGVQQDVFKSQLERSRMLDMRITLEQQRKTLSANLNALLYRSPDVSVGKISDFEVTPLSLTAEELRTTAYENRPLLRSYKALIEKGEAGHKLAEKEFYPDFNVAFEYMQRDRIDEMERGDNMYSLGVTFNLPVRRERRQAALAESSSEISMATEEANSLKNSISFGISDLMAQLEKRRKLIELYKTGLLPQAAQSLESATISYRVNKVDFLTLLDSRVTLFNYEREYYDSLADYQMKLAQLEALVGKEIQ